LPSWLRAGLILLFVAGAVPAMANDAASPPWRHALSLVGEPKYPIGFRKTDYVNPDAPAGGRARIGALGTFDNFNPAISGVKGNLASHLMLIYEPLLWASADETTTEYGLVAEAVRHPDDISWAEFRLRPEARWHDGRRMTPDDVVFSFETWKRLSPGFNRTFQHVTAARVTGPHAVRFDFATRGDRTLPLYIGQMSVLPRHWWDGRDASGRKRDIGMTTLEPPLGSGPYRLKGFVAGRSLTYERVADYWGRHVPIRVGTYHVGELQIEYFRDPAVMFEAFKADRLDFRREGSLKNWASAYEWAKDQPVSREGFAIERLGILRAFAFNMRRDRFADWRVRKALSLAFGFDEINRGAFHGLMERAASYFPNTDFQARGAPGADELALLAGIRADVPDETASAIVERPLAERPRVSLFKALKLLRQAGYRLDEGRLVKAATGEQLALEFLLQDPGLEKLASAYGDALGKLGIDVRIRVVDDVQYQNRLRTHDFDIVVQSWVQGHAPGSEQRDYWSSESADRRGANNVGGIRSRAVDALVERMIHAESRADLVTAGRLLDRVLRASHYTVPINVEGREFVAWRERLAKPANMPRYAASGFPELWWAVPERKVAAGAR
jgi:microcin C transport system substrate-binding protein